MSDYVNFYDVDTEAVRKGHEGHCECRPEEMVGDQCPVDLLASALDYARRIKASDDKRMAMSAAGNGQMLNTIGELRAELDEMTAGIEGWFEERQDACERAERAEAEVATLKASLASAYAERDSAVWRWNAAWRLIAWSHKPWRRQTRLMRDLHETLDGDA